MFKRRIRIAFEFCRPCAARGAGDDDVVTEEFTGDEGASFFFAGLYPPPPHAALAEKLKKNNAKTKAVKWNVRAMRISPVKIVSIEGREAPGRW